MQKTLWLGNWLGLAVKTDESLSSRNQARLLSCDDTHSSQPVKVSHIKTDGSCLMRE